MAHDQEAPPSAEASQSLEDRPCAMDNDLTLKAAAMRLGFVSEAEFDRVVDPKKMVKPYVATAESLDRT
jgi:hypothetical protein